MNGNAKVVNANQRNLKAETIEIESDEEFDVVDNNIELRNNISRLNTSALANQS